MDEINLFRNKTYLWKVDELQPLLDLLCKYIESIDEMVEKNKCDKTDSYEGTCYLFAKSIMEYAKASMDNLLLGHFKISSIINRIILENYVCFELIYQYKEEALWKYWIIYSFYHSQDKFGKKDKKMLKKFKDKMIKENKIEKIYFNKFINERYGWTFKVNDVFNFRGLCDLVDVFHYKDFIYESEYVHGVSLFQKENPFSLDGEVLNSITLLFVHLKYFAETYCSEDLHTDYFEVENKIIEIITKIIDFKIYEI